MPRAWARQAHPGARGAWGDNIARAKGGGGNHRGFFLRQVFKLENGFSRVRVLLYRSKGFDLAAAVVTSSSART